MSQVIYKYPLELTTSNTLRLPFGAELLLVGLQGGVINVWAKVEDSEEEFEDHHIRIYGTGHLLSDSEKEYLGSVFQGGYVWHIYEEFGNGWV